MKVLNLYAGIGGNRKFWDKDHTGLDLEITAVEIEPKIAAIYQDFFPQDKVIVADANQYLLEHFGEFEFIWSSPPCPTHSRMENIHYGQGYDVRYPDMKLYQEIILLKYRFSERERESNNKFCVENVISYYEPLIKPIESSSHYFWTNFWFSPAKNITRKINTGFKDSKNKFKDKRAEMLGINLDKYDIAQSLKEKMINNCVEPEIGLHILNESTRNIQPELFTTQQGG